LMHICVDETLVASLDDVPLDDVSLDASLVVSCYNVLYNLVQSCRKLCSLAVQLIAGWWRCMFRGLLHVHAHSGKQLSTSKHNKLNKTNCLMNTSSNVWTCFEMFLKLFEYIFYI
jgi:hypothetical protein